MTKRLQALGAVEARLVSANRWLVIALMAAMAVLVFANVVSRYLLNYSIIWVEELTRYMMVWVGFLGAGLVLRPAPYRSRGVPGPAAAARAGVRAGIVVLLCVTFAAMTWLGARAAFAWDQETPVLNWSTGRCTSRSRWARRSSSRISSSSRRATCAREFGKDESFHVEEAVL